MPLNVPHHSERTQVCFVEKPVNRMVTQSDESAIPMTPTVFHSPHHGYRFFANALNDALPSPVILSRARILCGETDKQNDETE